MNKKEVFQEERKQNSKLDSCKSKIRDKISKLEDELVILAEEKEEIITSEEYNQLFNLKAKRREIELEAKKIRDSIYADFSILGRPLKKYKRNAEQYENIIGHYAANVLNALLTDHELKIVKILEDISGNIEEGELHLKDKKAQKVIEQISRMDQQYFRDFLKEYNSIMENKERIESKIEENGAEEKVDGIDRKQDSTKSEIDHMKQELESKKHDFVKKLKQCPKCGREIPIGWQYHKECGWKEERKIEEDAATGKVKIEVFTSPTCPHCHPALNLAKQIEKERDDVKVTELSTATPHGHRKAQQMEVMSVPTTFVTGSEYPQKIAFRGLPSKKGLLKAVDISLGKAEWEEPKGFFRSLLEKLPIKIKW
ncbi:MAG: thioredoxin family protein [Nanoarchaeota archaeon]|nr:thioredoxin family protein [Nanoarchaeota archaeon]